MSLCPSHVGQRCKIEERWVRSDRGKMRYLYGGVGPPLLLIHGLLAYSFSWRFNLPVFAEHFTVYAPDLLGTGFSERPAGLDCDLRSTAGRLLKFTDAMGIHSCDIIGTSQGGAVTMMLADLGLQQKSALIRRMVLSAPANPWSKHGRLLAPVLGSSAGSALFRTIFPLVHFAHPWVLSRLYGDRRRISPGTLEGYQAPFDSPGGFEYGLAVARCWRADMTQIESVLPRIAHIPTLLIWGKLDVAVLPESAPELQKRFQNCQLVMFDDAGHVPYEEVPERFNRTVLDFLEREPMNPSS